MSLYHYRAADSSGETVEGDIDARDETGAIERIQGMGLIPIRIELANSANSARIGTLSLFRPKRITRDQLGAFTRELSTLLRSGLPLDRGLEILIQMSTTSEMETLLGQIREEVRGGASLSKALQAHPEIFDRFYIGMIRAGEAGGALGSVLERISEFMERSKELRETVTSALIYPTILVLASITSVILLLIFVVPQFSQMFEQSGKALPLPTQLVISTGEWLKRFWWGLPIGSWILWRYFLWQTKEPIRKLALDKRLLRITLVGDLLIKVEVARFARTLGTLLSNGIALLPALTIVKDTVNNGMIAQSLEAAREKLQAGQGLSKPMMAQGVFPPLAVHMIGVGEETGQLDVMLTRIADVYDREVSLAVKRMLALMEPVLILGLGLVIGGIILSILLAILKVNSLVG